MPPVLLKVLWFCFASSSLSALEHLDWPPVSLIFSRVSEMVLHVAISALVFLQENGAAAVGMGVFTAVTSKWPLVCICLSIRSGEDIIFRMTFNL
ncbi:hypothetical protein J1605_013463 [Eschrichtius robustus]|uniref:Secreted protein n=1 Tax=Eschrichtius robustus TaxID=9764 RepID=A0AB34GGL9_ESCRO|nr:hypothetical protein J1605_013463 [Eschrichtius robustus]